MGFKGSQIATRRAFLLGLSASTVAVPAMAVAPNASLFPQMRPVDFPQRSHPAAQALIKASKLTGQVACVVRHGESGEILEEVNGDTTLPPASVAKALTAAYALTILGENCQFNTSLLATGPISDGVLNGDLILAGGGDPTLDTDDLNALAKQLAGVGVTRIKGRFLVWGGTLSKSLQIDKEQPAHVGYNPAVSGLNVNFNRVHFEWKRSGNSYSTTMKGPSATLRPDVTMARMSVQDRAVPIYTYSDADDYDNWTVARGALGNGGARWLPVRKPELYAGQIFQKLTPAYGVTLPVPEVIDALPTSTRIASIQSASLREIVQGMLKYSTNLTAEVVGLAASKAKTGRALTIVESAAEMCAWLKGEFGLQACNLIDHSGLGGDSRISARDMSLALHHLKTRLPLKSIMKEFTLLDAQRRVIKDHPLHVQAKTGTLNFVSGLAGHVELPNGQELDFAIFAGDVPRRESLPRSQRERPEGGAVWNRRAKTLQQALIERWGEVYAG